MVVGNLERCVFLASSSEQLVLALILSDTLSDASAKAESKSKNFIRWHNGRLLFYCAAPPEEIFIRFGIVPDFAKTSFCQFVGQSICFGFLSSEAKSAHILLSSSLLFCQCLESAKWAE